MSVPGVVTPEINPFPENSNSIRTAGIAIGNASVAKQMNLLKTANGGSKGNKGKNKGRKGGAANQFVVPQFNVPYYEPGAGSQTVNGAMIGTTKLGAGSAASSAFDVCIGQGPSCTAAIENQKGGVKWGCYSGGKNKSRSRSRKSRTKKCRTKKCRKSRSRKSKSKK